MFMMNLRRLKKDQKGFTLAELTVAMGVGAIVLSMAIAFLVSFASTSYQANAKSDVTNSSRLAITRVLKDVSGATSLPDCAQWKNQQVATDSKNPALNTLEFKKRNCIQLISSSTTLAWAQPKAVCWYKTTETNTGSGVVFPDRMACLYKGDAPAPCKLAANSDKETIYTSQCTIGSAVTLIPNTSKIVADLGPHKDSAASPGNLPVRAPLFKYVNYDTSAFNGNVSKVLKINLNASISYENGRFVGGQKDYGVYKFSSTIQLSGMRAFLESGAYGN